MLLAVLPTSQLTNNKTNKFGVVVWYGGGGGMVQHHVVDEW